MDGAQRHERTEERLCLLNDYNPRTLTTRVVMVTMEAYFAWASSTPPARSGPSPV